MSKRPHRSCEPLESRQLLSASAELLDSLSEGTASAAQLVIDTDPIVMFTRGGDANMDGRIDEADYARIDANVGRVDVVGWADGDFNLDGQIDIDDYGIIDANR